MENSAGTVVPWSEIPQDKLYKAGIAQLRERKFQDALKSLNKAALLCSCYHDFRNKGKVKTKGKHDARPHIATDDCTLNTNNLSLAFRNRTAGEAYLLVKNTGPCGCGRPYLRCQSNTHLAVLDGIAQAHESLRDPFQALLVSSLMVRIAPTLPSGYCRMVKILRYALKSRSNEATVRPTPMLTAFLQATSAKSVDEIDDLLCAVACKGLAIVRLYGSTSAHKFDLLSNLASKFEDKPSSSVDPITALPAEVRTMIFTNVDLTCLLRCTAVSKTWNAILNDEFYWRKVTLNRPTYVRTRFNAFLQRHQGIRELAISDTSLFTFTHAWVTQLLRSLKSLESLHLRSPVDLPWKEFPREPWVAPSPPYFLKKLSLVNFGQSNTKLITWILHQVRPNLEELILSGTPNRAFDVFGADQSAWRLKVLRLDFKLLEPHQRTTQVLPMEQLVSITPDLEQLYLDGFQLNGPQITDLENNAIFRTAWPKLRVLVLGRRISAPPECVPLPWLNPDMRVVDLLLDEPWLMHKILFEFDPEGFPASPNMVPELDSVTRTVNLPYLEVFRSWNRIYHDAWLEAIVGPAIAAGNMRLLDLCVALDFRMVEPMSHRKELLPAKDWQFTFSDQITTLGLRHFGWDDSRDYVSSFNPQPFLQYLDRFPSVQTVRVFPDAKANTLRLIMGILERSTQVKTIYQDCLDSREWFVAKAEADRRGVKLHYKFKEHGPVLFPFRDNWSKKDAERAKEAVEAERNNSV